MITENLYETVLIEPARRGGSKLDIISGYASGAFAANHLNVLSSIRNDFSVRLIIGMFPRNGPLQANHRAFKQLSQTDYPNNFECRYIISPPPVHIKAYTWYSDNNSLPTYVGSANYTGYAFARTGAVVQKEAVTQSDPVSVQEYFETLWNIALDCRLPEADQRVTQAILDYRARAITRVVMNDLLPDELPVRVPSVELTLLSTRTREVHKPGAGLNWGQPTKLPRGERTGNEAYIPVPSNIAKGNFFPAPEIRFTLTSDDGTVFICTREQEGGKAITTPISNSELGLYFRQRLNVPSGASVTTQDLYNYGRTDVVVTKIDDENYLMDFSIPRLPIVQDI